MKRKSGTAIGLGTAFLAAAAIAAAPAALAQETASGIGNSADTQTVDQSAAIGQSNSASLTDTTNQSGFFGGTPESTSTNVLAQENLAEITQVGVNLDHLVAMP